jgi:hypothetical protein
MPSATSAGDDGGSGCGDHTMLGRLCVLRWTPDTELGDVGVLGDAFVLRGF